MLNFFPTPYPEELWYSVLCRYHVRSGNQKYATTAKELFGNCALRVTPLFPNNAVASVLKQLPNGFLNARNVLLQHTAFSYYMRMYNEKEKQQMLQELINGTATPKTHIWKTSKKEEWRLRYCPLCAKEDIKNYGETYWHVQHQIPIMSLCPIHLCRLKKTSIRIQDMMEHFLPVQQDELDFEVSKDSQMWENFLCKAAYQYLRLPLENAPTHGYNNLTQSLANQGFREQYCQSGVVLNAGKLYREMNRLFGKELVETVIGQKLSDTVINRISHWTLATPDRYLLLQTLANIPTEQMFGVAQMEDKIKLIMVAMRNSGVIYAKKEVAKRLGVFPSQVDTLANNFDVEPFWVQIGKRASGEKRTKAVKVYLTETEFRILQLDRKKLGFAYDGQLLLFAYQKLMGGLSEASKK